MKIQYAFWSIGITISTIGIFGLSGNASAPPTPPLRGGMFSDLHFDPLADPTIIPQLISAPIGQWDAIFKSSKVTAFAQYGSDSNYPLMVSALAEARKQASNGYVVFTGDALRHSFSSAFTAAGGTSQQFPAFATKTMLYVVGKIQADFKVPVVIALGNNDTLEGDYTMSPNSKFLATLSKTINVVKNSPTSQATFRYGGYYTMRNPTTPAHEIIVLNSVLWSPSYSTGGSKVPVSEPGEREMAWLTHELAAAKSMGQKVSLAMHIPPGMNAYSSSKKKPTLMWTATFTSKFNALLDKYQGTFAMSFAGHTHMDDFRVYSNPKPTFAIRTTPAVSPMFGNNPSVSAFTYNRKSGEIIDVETHYVSLTAQQPVWTKEYAFTAAYGLKGYNASTLAKLASQIRANGSASQSYEKYYAVSAVPYQITSTTLPDYSCSETSFSIAAFEGCMKGRE